MGDLDGYRVETPLGSWATREAPTRRTTTWTDGSNVTKGCFGLNVCVEGHYSVTPLCLGCPSVSVSCVLAKRPRAVYNPKFLVGILFYFCFVSLL